MGIASFATNDRSCCYSCFFVLYALISEYQPHLYVPELFAQVNKSLYATCSVGFVYFFLNSKTDCLQQNGIA